MGNSSNPKSQNASRRAAARHLAIVKARNRRIILLTVCLCLCLVLITGIVTGLYLLLRKPADDGKILNNVLIGGISVGGMTKEDAESVISLSIEPVLTQQSMIIRLDNDSLELSPELTGIALDVEDLVEAAYAYGRTGSRAEQNLTRAKAETQTYTIALLPYLRLNLSNIRSAVEDFCSHYSVEMVDPVVSIDGQRPTYNPNGNSFVVHQTLTITMGYPESYLDPNALYYEILDAYSLFQMELIYEVPVLVEPAIPNAEAIFDAYCISPVDATIDSKTFEVTEEVYGYGFNVYTLQRLIDRADYGETIEITLDFLMPDITAADLSGNLFQDLLVSYTATSTGSSTNRNKNLATACKTLNGLVLKAGESLDLNEVLGPRTSERKYYSAPTYIGSATSVIGGGIDQIASALYYCALRADLQIVEHTHHRYAVSYTPMGTDAAMTNSENLVFTNTTSAPIRILAEANGGNVKITFLGTEDKDYLLDIESVVVSQTMPETMYQPMHKDNVYGYKNGDVIQTGLVGYVVETYLCKYDPVSGLLVSRELLHTVSYETRDIIIIRIENEE